MSVLAWIGTVLGAWFALSFLLAAVYAYGRSRHKRARR